MLLKTLERGITVRCPTCGAVGLELRWFDGRFEARCPKCGWRSEAKRFLEVGPVGNWRSPWRFENVVVVLQKALINGKPMRYALLFTPEGEPLVIAVKRIAQRVNAPEPCLMGCSMCPFRQDCERGRFRPGEMGYTSVVLKTVKCVVLGTPGILTGQGELLAVICPADKPHGLPNWIFYLLGLAVFCPECKDWRKVYPRDVAKGIYRCENCGAEFRVGPRD